MSNPLDNHPRIREILYMIQWIVTGITAVLSALFGFMYGSPDEWPDIFLAVLAVTPVLWSYLGLTAKGNITPADPPEGYEFVPVSRNQEDVDYPLF